MIEAVSGQGLDTYMRNNIFGPLRMCDTGFLPDAGQSARSAQVHSRKPDGALEPIALTLPVKSEFFAGGGALWSTGPDYMAFLRMLLHGGSLNGSRVLREETVASMAQNHIGDLDVQKLPLTYPSISHDAEFFPGMRNKWGLTWLINTEDVPGRHSAGSLAWAGLFNTYYWLDPVKQVTGGILTQILPFADPTVLGLLNDFEAVVYRAAMGAAA